LGNPDILHANNFFCPRGLRQARLVYTLYDLSFLVHPEWTTEQNRTACFQGVYDASLHADLILSISQYSRDHFLEVFPHYPPERLQVVYPASRFSGTEGGPRPETLPSLAKGRFWLNVGVLEPRKNHRGLLRAYARFTRKRREEIPLVLAGGRGWLMDDFQKDLEDLDLTRDVIMLGYTDDRSLRWLYQNCLAFVYPSLFEGFGMPVLEAMSLGAPVVASKVSSIPEIVGEAGILVDPTKDEDIHGAMRALQAAPDMGMKLGEKAIQRARQFSWESAARSVLEGYGGALSTEPFSKSP
jgi:glycosyltransferase involved in cell wall biosynthesis